MTSQIKRVLQASCAVAAITFGSAGAALAQSGQVEEIIVTAQRRSENLQMVPVSVDSISGERLATIFSTGQDIIALAARSPGLYAESSNGRVAPRFYIRGLGNSDFDLAASQPVSIIMDEVVLENVVLKSTPIFDVDRIEVLRGPQGTLFGRNTTAGIVKFDSIKPGDTLSARMTSTLTSFGGMTFDGGVGGPIVEGKVAARLSMLSQYRKDWIDNGFTGEDDALGGYAEQAARLQLLLTPTDEFSLLFNLHGRKLEGTAAVFRANILTKGSNKLNASYDRDTVYFDGGQNNPQAYDGWGTSANISYDFGGAALTSITAFEETSGSSRGDIDGGNLAGPGFIPFPSESEDGLKRLVQFSQEVRLASDGGGPFSWQTGAYFFDTSYQIRTDPGFAPPTTQQQDNRSWAVFGQASFDVSDALTLTGGLRYTSDEKELEVVDGPNPVAPISVSDEKTSWDISAFYTVAPAVSVYAKVASGFRGPSIQGRDIAFFAPPSVAQSETILSYELGLKSELLDRRLRLNAAVYAYTLDDPQFSAVGGGSNSNRLINAKKGEAKGIEIDGQFVVSPNLVVTAGYSLNDTKIKDAALATAPCAACTVTDTLAGGLALVNGNPFPNAPKSTFDFTVRASMPYGNGGEFFAFTDWAFQGKTNLFLYESLEFNSKNNFEGGLKVGYARTDGSWEAAVFARNITNEHNLLGGIDFNNLTGFVNEPRIIGVSLSAAFQ